MDFQRFTSMEGLKGFWTIENQSNIELSKFQREVIFLIT